LKLLHSTILGKTGPDLLILHGFLGMSDNWKTHAKNWVDSGFRVHLIDQRNHGRSFWSADFSYEVMAADLAYYCEAKKLDKVLLLGHSMGGKTVMFFTTHYPEFVSAFIVADIAPKSYPPHHQKILEGLSRLDFNTIQSRGAADAFLAQYVTEPGVRLFLLKNLYWKNKETLGLRVNIAILKNASEAIGANLAATAHSSQSCLFVKGESSDYIEAADLPLIQHYFPKATLITIPKAGHWLHAEQPVLFFEQVTQWLLKQI